MRRGNSQSPSDGSTLGREKTAGLAREPGLCGLRGDRTQIGLVAAWGGGRNLYSSLIKGSAAFLVLGAQGLLGSTCVLWAFWLRCLHRNARSDLSGSEANVWTVETVFAHLSHLLHCTTDDEDDLIFLPS